MNTQRVTVELSRRECDLILGALSVFGNYPDTTSGTQLELIHLIQHIRVRRDTRTDGVVHTPTPLGHTS